MNWSPFPYLRIAFVFTLGVLVNNYLEINPNLIYVCLLFFCLCWGILEIKLKNIFYKSLINSVLMLLSIFCLGSSLIALKNRKMDNQWIKPGRNESYQFISGTIIERLKTDKRFKYVLEVEHLLADGKIKPKSATVLITFLKTDSLATKYEPGVKVILKTKLKPIDTVSNPEAFDYRKHLKYKGIQQIGFVENGNHHTRNDASDFWFKAVAVKASKFASVTLRKYLKDSTTIATAEALIIGQQVLIPKDVYKAYAETGAIHVLSVSGLHVAIFISPFIWLFGLSKRKDKIWISIQILSLVSIIWFYVILTGMSSSVVRSGTMLSIYIIGSNLFKGTNTFNILSVAGILMLIYNPYYLFQVSFQFSFISLMSILYFQPKIKSLCIAPNKIIAFMWDLINVSLAAQIFIFPFTVYYFHQFPVYFALSGLIAVPLVTVIIYVSSLIIMLEPLFNPVNLVLATILDGSIHFLNYTIQGISKFPFSTLKNIWISDFCLALMVITLMIYIFWLELRKIRAFYVGLIFITFIIAMMSFDSIKATRQQILVIYSTFGGTLIDIFKGETLFTVKTGKISSTTVDFVAVNNRIKHRYKNQNYSDKFLHKIGEKHVYIFNNYHDFKLLKKNTPLDILFVTHSQNNRPDDILKYIVPKYIVLDKNLKPWTRKKWLNLPDTVNVKIHDISTEGAFVFQNKL